MSDFNQPTNISAYTGIWAVVRAMFAALAKWDFTGIANVPTSAKRYDSGTGKLQSWNGSAWVDLSVHFGNAVGIGTTSPNTRLEVANDTDGQTAARVRNGDTGTSATAVVQLGNNENAAAAGITLYGTNNTSGGNAGGVSFVVGTTRALAFGVAGAEKYRLDSNGRLLVGKTAVASGNPGVHLDTTAAHVPISINKTASGTVNGLLCSYSGTYVGGVDFSNTATSFPTSSDHRLKENVVPLAGVRGRFRRLRPYRFNFVAEPGETVDGFLAHEAAEVVPNAVRGEKDGVVEVGDVVDAAGAVVTAGVREPAGLTEGLAWVRTGEAPVYQAIDHSKMVPLLTAALLEEMDRADALEERVAALEARLGG